MNEICRLCLSITDQKMYKLTKECDVFIKIQTCLSVKIQIKKSLPQHICTQCIQEIGDIYEYHKTITENQKKLQRLAESGLNVEEIYMKLNVNSPEEENVTEKNCTENENFVEMETALSDNFTDQNSRTNVKQENVNGHFNSHGNDAESSCDNSMLFLTPKDINVTENEIKKEPENTSTKNSIQLQQYKCLTCFETLETQTCLIKHYHIVHRNPVEAREPTYMVIEGVSKSFRCEVCDKLYDKKKDMIKHVELHRRPFICKICGRTYKTVTEIVRHSRAHNGHKLLCSYQCGFTTAYKGALKDHEKRHMEKPDYKYKCTECGKGFFVKTWYEQHQNIHNGLKPFVCDLCGMAFHIERYLTAHRSSVHQQTSNVRRYVCVHCLHPCDCAKSLAEHLKEHGIKTEFLCDECGKIFKNADKLRNHKYTHLQLKPYTCSICNKSFAKKFTLKLHENAHTGERLHSCAHCDKRYVQKATLHRHYRRHHSSVTQPT